MPITSAKCEYCGSVFYDFANIDLDAPSYVRVKKDGELLIFRARVNEFTVSFSNEVSSFYADDAVVAVKNDPRLDIDVSMTALPDDRGVLLERYKEEK
jgi:hypothetical protein